MSDERDRFGDLGEPRSAAERFAELDEREPEPPPRRPAPRPSSRYSWVVGIAFLVAIAVAGLNAITTEGPALEPGEEAPLFVAPLAVTGLDRDANADADRVCELRLPETLNLCSLRGRPVVLTFFFTRFADCEPQLDAIERARARMPGVVAAGVLVRESHASAARLVREGGWGFPVALDRDGLVSNLYGIRGCPTTVFIRRDGTVGAKREGLLSPAEVVREARRLR